MKKVVKIETLDGFLFDSSKEATRHTEKLIADQVSKHAHKIAGLKWIEIGDYILENIADFQIIADLQKDLILEEIED